VRCCKREQASPIAPEMGRLSRWPEPNGGSLDEVHVVDPDFGLKGRACVRADVPLGLPVDAVDLGGEPLRLLVAPSRISPRGSVSGLRSCSPRRLAELSIDRCPGHPLGRGCSHKRPVQRGRPCRRPNNLSKRNLLAHRYAPVCSATASLSIGRAPGRAMCVLILPGTRGAGEDGFAFNYWIVML
jgi:hypothetical protein